MLTITAENLGKKYLGEKVFSSFNHTFVQGKSYAVLGHNGSGKSTLLQLLATLQMPSSGSVQYAVSQNAIAGEEVYRYASFAAPYQELIEEFTLAEMLDFHVQFRQLVLPKNEILELAMLQKEAYKQVKHCSSGMKQRFKLALAIVDKAPVLFLDEPCTNLDDIGSEWYHKQMATYTKEKLVVVSSNQEIEYNFCTEQILIEKYK